MFKKINYTVIFDTKQHLHIKPSNSISFTKELLDMPKMTLAV